MTTPIITLIGIALNLAAAWPPIAWLCIPGGVLATTGAIRQYRDALPCEVLFGLQDWKAHDRDFRIFIVKKRHRKEKPTVTVYKGESPSFEMVSCEISCVERDTIVIGSNLRFRGKVVVK